MHTKGLNLGFAFLHARRSPHDDVATVGAGMLDGLRPLAQVWHNDAKEADPQTAKRPDAIAVRVRNLSNQTNDWMPGLATYCVHFDDFIVTLVSDLRRQNGQSIISGWSPSSPNGVTVSMPELR